jgi:uncharacterized protein
VTNLEFEWDLEKARINFRKHGVRFEDAVFVFRDPLHVTFQDRIEGGEYRWQTTGEIFGTTLVVVAHTYIDERSASVEVVRIISARKASKSERKRYENEDR